MDLSEAISNCYLIIAWGSPSQAEQFIPASALFIHERSGGSEAVYQVEVLENPSIPDQCTFVTTPNCSKSGNSYTIQMQSRD